MTASLFFSNDDLKFVTLIQTLNNTLGLASQALEYTSDNDHHLRVYYKNVLEQMVKDYDPNIMIKLYAMKYGISESEAPSHMLKMLNAHQDKIAQQLVSVQSMPADTFKNLYDAAKSEEDLRAEGYEPVSKDTGVVWVKK